MSRLAERTAQTSGANGPLVSPGYQRRQRGADLAVEEAIKRRIKQNGTYAFYFNEVACECVMGVLKVHGRVPTDRLKNVLWSLVRDLEGVIDIDDQVDVINSTGLSNVHPRQDSCSLPCQR